MNIYFLDKKPILSALYLDDSLSEGAFANCVRSLVTAVTSLDHDWSERNRSISPYKIKSSLITWIEESLDNFVWTHRYAVYLWEWKLGKKASGYKTMLDRLYVWIKLHGEKCKNFKTRSTGRPTSFPNNARYRNIDFREEKDVVAAYRKLITLRWREKDSVTWRGSNNGPPWYKGEEKEDEE